MGLRRGGVQPRVTVKSSEGGGVGKKREAQSPPAAGGRGFKANIMRGLRGLGHAYLKINCNEGGVRKKKRWHTVDTQRAKSGHGAHKNADTNGVDMHRHKRGRY